VRNIKDEHEPAHLHEPSLDFNGTFRCGCPSTLSTRSALAKPVAHTRGATCDRAAVPPGRFRNAKIRAAFLLAADNLIKCNEYWRGKYNLWKSQGHDPRDLRCRIANRFTRTVFHMVAGRKIYQHRSRLDRGYFMQKLLDFLRDRQAPAATILTTLKDAADQLPKTAKAEEAQLLSDIQRKAVNSPRNLAPSWFMFWSDWG